MIAIEKKAEHKDILVTDTDQNRIEAIRKIAAERHRKSDTDGRRRRDRQTAADNRLV